jgi:hypothetical protein
MTSPNPWKLATKTGRLAERQGKQTRTQQENAGDGHCQKCIGGKFFTHGNYPTSARRNGSGAPCEIVFADFSHPCPAMPAVKPAVFAVKQGERFPHDRTPLFDRELNIRHSFRGVFAAPKNGFVAPQHCFMRGPRRHSFTQLRARGSTTGTPDTAKRGEARYEDLPRKCLFVCHRSLQSAPVITKRMCECADAADVASGLYGSVGIICGSLMWIKRLSADW